MLILTKGLELNIRIIQWSNYLSEYNILVYYRPNNDPIMLITNGLSRMPIRYTSIPKVKDNLGLLYTIVIDTN